MNFKKKNRFIVIFGAFVLLGTLLGVSNVKAAECECKNMNYYLLVDASLYTTANKGVFEKVCKGYGGTYLKDSFVCDKATMKWDDAKTGEKCENIEKDSSWVASRVYDKLKAGGITGSVSKEKISTAFLKCTVSGSSSGGTSGSGSGSGSTSGGSSSGSESSSNVCGGTVTKSSDLLKCAKTNLNPGIIKNPFQLIGFGIKFDMAALGAVSLGLYIWAGFLYMTAGGNAEQRGKAIKTLLWVTLGLVAIFSSYMIMKYVFGQLIN